MPFEQSAYTGHAFFSSRALLSTHSLRRRAAPLLMAGLLACVSSPSAAQQHRSDKPDDQAYRNRSIVPICVRSADRYAVEKDKFLEYFGKYYFPSMTRIEPENLGRLGDARYDMFRRVLWAASSEALQRDLTAIAYPVMQKIVVANNPSYHPAVRYNAVLIIGMLDEQYAIDGGGNARPPKPLLAANKFLVQVVNLGAAGKAVPPPLIAGALVGLERHARFRAGLPPEAVAAMSTAALKLVNQTDPPLDIDSEVYAWMRLQAASMLAELGVVGTNNDVHDALVQLIADGKSLDDRTATAALTAKIKYEGAKVEGPATADAMLKLASDLAAAEAERAKKFEDMRFDGTGGGGFSPGPRRFGGEEFGGGYSGEQQEEDYPRRHVLARLSDLRTGLRTLKAVVAEEGQQKFDAVLAAIAPAITATANKDTVGLNVARAVRNMADTVRGIAAPAATEEADAAAAFDELPAEDAPAAVESAVETPPPAAAATAPVEQ